MRTLLKRRLTAFVSPAGGKRRRALGLAAGLALASGFALAQGKPDTSQLAAGPIEISAVPIEYFERNGDPQARARTQYGKLRWLGGLVLTSASPGFGGWSGLAFDPEGKRLLAISDAGSWMTAELVYAKRRLVGLANAEIGPLKATGGKPLLKPRDRDAEAVSLASGTLESGSLLITFERNNRIGKFAVEGGKVSPPAAYLKMPQESRQMRTNGFESVSMLRDGPYKGSVIAFAEQKLPRQSLHTGWIWVGNEPKRLSLTDIEGFDVTDVAALADGGILVLERRFRWAEGVRMRLRRIAAAGIEPGATLDGEILIEADMGREIDNMEGLAVREGPRGETLVTMISDDNFNSFLQRTVLLEFALDSGASVKVESETPSPVQAGAPAAPVPVNSR